MMVKKIIITLAVLLIMAINVNCGKKGPLVLEPEAKPEAVLNFKISQMGTDIRLQWDFPATMMQRRKKIDMEFDKISRILIHYSPKSILDGKFKKKSKVIKKLTMQDLTLVPDSPVATVTPTRNTRTKEKKNLTYSVLIPMKMEKLLDKDHFFAVRYIYKKKKSPISTVVSIRTAMPIKPATGLNITRENKVLKLKWTRPHQDEGGNPVNTIAGYNIFKKIEPEESSEQDTQSQPRPPATTSANAKGSLEGFAKLNKSNVLTEFFEDDDTGTNGKYSYYVTTLISSQIESGPSIPVTVDITDIYPPEVPANLVAFRTSEYMHLTWKDVPDSDLSHYKIYRRTPQIEEFALIANKVTTNHFKDVNVVRGRAYFYVVTSVDKKGNESKYSIEVKERF
jgi:predicted small lipoprotein YifL